MATNNQLKYFQATPTGSNTPKYYSTATGMPSDVQEVTDISGFGGMEIPTGIANAVSLTKPTGVTPFNVNTNPDNEIVGNSKDVRNQFQKLQNELNSLKTQQSNQFNQIGALNTQAQNIGATSFDEEQRIKQAGISAGRQFDPLIMKAQEEMRQGMPKAVIGAGERGGFMNTQFAGIGALLPTQGAGFVGAGGKLEGIRSAYSLNISTLEAQKQTAIAQAEDAMRNFIRTGKQQDLTNAQNNFKLAQDASKQQSDLVNQMTTSLINTQRLEMEMNKPILDANARIQEFALSQMEKYPSAFADLEITDLQDLTPNEINRRIIGSQEYKLELASAGLDEQYKRAQIAKIYGDMSGTGGSGNIRITPEARISNPQVGAITDAFNQLTVRMSQDQRKAANQVFTDLINRGDVDGAKSYIVSSILATAPTAQQDKILGRFEALSALDTIEAGLKAFKDRGGDTGIITGGWETIYNKLGKTTDPELAEVANTIRMAIVDYRRAVSGAAFTESEGKEYERLFPSIGRYSELNDAKVSSLRDAFNRNNKVIVGTYIGGPSQYDAIFKDGIYSASGNDFSEDVSIDMENPADTPIGGTWTDPVNKVIYLREDEDTFTPIASSK